MTFGKTTDLEEIRNHPHRFTWGRIKKIHDIGAQSNNVHPYTIVEAWDKEDTLFFHVYVDGKNQSISAWTLEGAILMGIARRFNPKTGNIGMLAHCALKVLRPSTVPNQD